MLALFLITFPVVFMVGGAIMLVLLWAVKNGPKHETKQEVEKKPEPSSSYGGYVVEF